MGSVCPLRAVSRAPPYKADCGRKVAAVGVGLTNNGGSCSRLSLTSFFLPLDLNGFSAREALPVPGFGRYTPPWEAKARETTARSLSLSLSLFLHLPGELPLVFFHRPFCRSGLVLPSQGPESEKRLIGRKLKPSQTNTEVRFCLTDRFSRPQPWGGGREGEGSL